MLLVCSNILIMGPLITYYKSAKNSLVGEIDILLY